MGELDAPSVPTYCSTYRARCWKWGETQPVTPHSRAMATRTLDPDFRSSQGFCAPYSQSMRSAAAEDSDP